MELTWSESEQHLVLAGLVRTKRSASSCQCAKRNLHPTHKITCPLYHAHGLSTGTTEQYPDAHQSVCVEHICLFGHSDDKHGATTAADQSSLPRHCLKVCAVGRRTLQRRALVIVFDAMTEANSVAPAML